MQNEWSAFKGCFFILEKKGIDFSFYFLLSPFNKKRLVVSYFFVLFLVPTSFAQQKNVLQEIDSMSHVFAKRGQWDSALLCTYKLRAVQPFEPSHLHNVACYHARKGNSDSALHYLSILADTLPHSLILSDPDFYTLLEYPQWSTLEDKYFNSKRIRNMVRDTSMARILLRMLVIDQAYYSDIEIEESNPKPDKTKIKSLWSKKQSSNKENLSILDKLVEVKGWPGMSSVGYRFADAAFLVVQHSDYNTMRKYYHHIKTACETGESGCAAQALLYDRIRTIEGKPQRYGSQVRLNEKTKKYELFPLEDTLNVNDYREYMGLGLLEDYVKNWDIELKIPKRKDPMAYIDSVVHYYDSGNDSKFPFPHGVSSSDLNKIIPLEPSKVVGKNNEWALVMPLGSAIVLKFVDNQIVNYPYQPDIFVKEEGASGDKAIVFVSHDGVHFDSLGITVGGRTSTLDLETINYTLPVRFVKLVSLNNNGSLPGFDLIHVKGTPLSSVPTSFSKKDIESYLRQAAKEEIIALPPAKQEVIDTKDILFASGKYVLTDKSKEILNSIVKKLTDDPKCKIELSGHTDDVGNKIANEELSLRRALEVADYLIAQGIDQQRIFTYGYSDDKPRETNANDQNRRLNRRVELVFFY